MKIRYLAALLALAPSLALAQSNTTFPTVQAGPPGQTSVWQQNGAVSNVRTYRLAVGSGAWAAAGEFLQMSGSATKSVYIRKIEVSAVATGAVQTLLSVNRESTAISGGTCAAQAANFGVLDTQNTVGSATATISLCSAAPTAGTVVSVLDVCGLQVAALAAGLPVKCVFAPGMNGGQPIRLTGTADKLGLVNATATGSGGLINVMVEWTEEP